MFEPEKLKPGMYLKLFHGFESDEARNEAQDWGVQGPTIGPLLWSHQTYNAHITLGVDQNRFDKSFLRDKKNFTVVEQGVLWLDIKDDCIHFDGMFYGDWEFVYITDETDSSDDFILSEDGGCDKCGKKGAPDFCLNCIVCINCCTCGNKERLGYE